MVFSSHIPNKKEFRIPSGLALQENEFVVYNKDRIVKTDSIEDENSKSFKHVCELCTSLVEHNLCPFKLDLLYANSAT